MLASRFAISALLALFCAPLAARPSAAEPDQYLVFEADEQGEARVVFQRDVRLSARRSSRSEADLERAERAAGRGDRVVTLRQRDASGRVVFRDAIRLPKWIRGEFHGSSTGRGGHRIEHFRVAQRQSVFVVRTPGREGVVELRGSARASRRLRDAGVPGPFAPPPPSGSMASPSGAMPPPPPHSENRLDLLLMGDGYTAAEAAKFQADAEDFENAFFGVTPYAEYRNYVNVNRLFTPSAESGADHPAYASSCNVSDAGCCSDPAAQSDGLAGTLVDTAFDAHYCANNIHRLLLVDVAKVMAAAAAMPDWDAILVMVNDATYGGSGGSIGVFSGHPAAAEIAIHEFGHSFTDLADEYESPYPGFPGCSDRDGPVCEANVTDEATPSFIKWAQWIASPTPIPTPEEDPRYASEVGLFEGARYRTSGMYRPCDRCAMRSMGAAFGEVCREAYVLKLYEGGWGAPAAGIDPIEPGSESPPPGPVAATGCGGGFDVSLLEPVGGPPLEVTWTVDGAPQAGAHSASYQFVAPGPGSYAIEVEVRDPTPLVHPGTPSEALESHRAWQLDVGPEDCTQQCDDGLDNDGDGLVDLQDPGCSGPHDTAELDSALACDDGADNDGDGSVDTADPGCSAADDPSENDSVLPCDDGLDNDLDGLTDAADPGCADSLDPDEISPALACDDGFDNDGDGLFDIDDPGCADAWGPSENDPNACGNGIPDAAEECDDWNDRSGDGCSATCTVEPGIHCFSSPSVCNPALVQSAEQQRCINQVNKSSSRVAREQGLVALRCIRDAGYERPQMLGAAPDDNAQACLGNDVRGGVARRVGQLLRASAAKCAPALLPSYAYRSPAFTGAAASQASLALTADLFGADLTTAVVARSEDATGSRCQREVAKRAHRLFDQLWRVALKGTRNALEGTAAPPVDTLEGLQLATLRYIFEDPKQQIARHAARLQSKTATRCADPAMETPLDELFPGVCASTDAADLARCADAAARCRFCESLEQIDGMAIDCDRFDNDAADQSCS